MLSPILTGFMLCFSLNCVVGAQNTYLFRQGMRNEYVYTLAIFCILSDLLLITIGVYGMSLIVNQFYIDVFLLLSAACLFVYGFIRIKNIVGLSYNLNEKVYMQKKSKKKYVDNDCIHFIESTCLSGHYYFNWECFFAI